MLNQRRSTAFLMNVFRSGFFCLIVIHLSIPLTMASSDPLEKFQRQLELILEKVDDDGMVDYSSLLQNRHLLDEFTDHLWKMDTAVYRQLDRKDQIAFWINVYNGLTLKAIIDHYPIQSSFLTSLRFPKNSIRQISGVWDSLQFGVMGSKRTLDEIEHEILRKDFDEPRIHMALVCAAKGCPPLRNRPYTGERLDEQLEDQSVRFLKDPLKFRIDRKSGTVYLSKIFDWFGKDFIEKYGESPHFGEKSLKQKAVLSFVSRYLSARDAKVLREADLRIKYLGYDWSLNEQGD